MDKGLLNQTIREDFNTKTYIDFRYNFIDFHIVNNIISADNRKKRICDLGCGDGARGQFMTQKGHDVVGVDISEPALLIAKSRGLQICKLDLETYRLPFENESFDAVTACSIIEHIFDTDRFLQEIRRILKPEGLLVIITPNTVSLGRRLCYLLGRGDFFESSLRDAAGHIRYFVKQSAMKLLKDNSFEPFCFCSDFINFTKSGSVKSRFLAILFPTLGGNLIVASKKQ